MGGGSAALAERGPGSKVEENKLESEREVTGLVSVGSPEKVGRIALGELPCFESRKGEK